MLQGKEDLIKLPQRCPPHQTLKERKLLEWRIIPFQEIVSGELKRSTAAVTHVWLSKKHFDPDGLKLARLKEVLASEACRWIEYVWLDFACVPQPWNDDGCYEQLSKEDEVLQKQSVERCLTTLYLGATVIALWDDGFNAKLWPSAELFVSCKTPTLLGLTPSLAEHHRLMLACMQSQQGQEAKIEEQVLKTWSAMSAATASDLFMQEKFKVTVARDRTAITHVVANIEADLRQLFRDQPCLITPRQAIAGLSFAKALCKLEFTIDVKHINRFLNRKTAIMLVAEQGRDDLLRLILAVPDVDVNAHDTSVGCTALLLAAREGHGAALQLLLADARTDVNAKADNGDSALTIALSNDRFQIVTLLLSHAGLDIDARSMRIAIEKELDEAIFAQILACPSLDLNKDLSSAKCSAGFRPLHLAVQRGSRRVVQQILDASSSVDINAQAAGGFTALHVAVEHDQVVAAEALLSWPSIDLNACTTEGFTPLSLAAINGRVQFIRMFLKRPDMSVGLPSVLALALQTDSSESEEIADSILAARAEVSTDTVMNFRELVRKVKSVREELVAGIGFPGKLLRAAVQEGNVDLLRLVLATPRLDVNSKVFFDEGTALQYAAERGRLEILKVLLQVSTIDVNANSSGWTALHAAAEHGHEGIVQALLGAPGIDTNILSGFYTPLAVAEQTRQDRVAALLRRGGGKRWSQTWLPSGT